VDKPLSPRAEKVMPDPLKPSSPKGEQGSPGAGGALTSPIHAAPNQDPVDASSVPRPAESPRMSPPRPQSHGHGVASGFQHGEGSSVP
jgi:hypothetical protein